MQTLYYSQVSQSLILTSETQNEVTYYWSGITSLILSASAYDTIDSGSADFGVTVGDLRLCAFSGSALVAQFPPDTTAVYYIDNGVPSNGITFLTSSTSYVGVSWHFSTNTTESAYLAGTGFSIYDSASSTYYAISVGSFTDSGFSKLATGNTYKVAVSGSGSYEAYLYINNITLGSNVFSSSASNTYLTASFIPTASYDYEITSSVVKALSICIGDGVIDACACNQTASVYFAGNFGEGTTIYSDPGLTTLYYNGVYPDIQYNGYLYNIKFGESILIASGDCGF